MVPQVGELFGVKLKHEVLWEALNIAPNRLVQCLDLNSVKLSQVFVQHDLLPTKQENGALNALHRDYG